MANFTKDDLKPNMIVETRSGSLYMIYEVEGELMLIGENQCEALSRYSEDLLLRGEYATDFDIMNVRKPQVVSQFREAYWYEAPVIWEREESPRITLFHIYNDEHELGIYTLKDIREFISDRYYNEYVDKLFHSKKIDTIGGKSYYDVNRLEDLGKDDLQTIVHELGFNCDIYSVENDTERLIDFANNIFCG